MAVTITTDDLASPGQRLAPAVAVLLAVVGVAQAAAVASRLGDGDHVGLRPGTERVVSDQLLSEGTVVRATIHPERFRPPVQEFYGEAGRDDPLAGRLLSVGSGFHDNVPVFPTGKAPGSARSIWAAAWWRWGRTGPGHG